MKVHIMHRLPSAYDNLRTKYRGLLDTTDMAILRKDIVGEYKALQAEKG